LKNTTHGAEDSMLTSYFKSSVKSVLLSGALLAVSFASSAYDNAKNIHDTWNNLLNKNVVAINNNHSTEVDYAGMQAQHHELKTYLDLLSSVTVSDFDRWEKPKQLAFLINAYNAWTVELILTKYPKLESIKDLGSFFSSPWSKSFISLLGEKRSLNEIEHDLIRGAVDAQGNAKYNDPRIHFAVNCASIGCPALRAEAYTAVDLEEQLQQQTVRFLSDNTRNIAQENTVKLSSIFKWYQDDFEKGYKGAYSLEAFILLYSDALKLTLEQKKSLKKDNMNIKFLDYNWDLNAHH